MQVEVGRHVHSGAMTHFVRHRVMNGFQPRGSSGRFWCGLHVSLMTVMRRARPVAADLTVGIDRCVSHTHVPGNQPTAAMKAAIVDFFAQIGGASHFLVENHCHAFGGRIGHCARHSLKFQQLFLDSKMVKGLEQSEGFERDGLHGRPPLLR